MNLRWAAILSLLLLCAMGIAQRGRAFITIEAHVGIAHSINLGIITGLEQSDYPFPPDGPYYGKAYKVTFLVSETIKGPAVKSFSFHLNLQHTTEITYLKQNNIELLLFHSDRYSDEEGEFGPGAPGNYYSFRILEKLKSDGDRLGTRDTADQLNINLNEGKMFDLNLNVISGRNNILKKARAFAKKHPRIIETDHLMVPNDFAAKIGYPNAYALIVLPICEETRSVLSELEMNPDRLLKAVPKKEREQRRKIFLSDVRRLLARCDEEIRGLQHKSILMELCIAGHRFEAENSARPLNPSVNI